MFLSFLEATMPGRVHDPQAPINFWTFAPLPLAADVYPGMVCPMQHAINAYTVDSRSDSLSQSSAHDFGSRIHNQVPVKRVWWKALMITVNNLGHGYAPIQEWFRTYMSNKSSNKI